MAYQSDFTGPQIDNVIRVCNEGSNLNNISKLDEYFARVDANELQLQKLYSSDGDIPVTIRELLDSKLSLNGGLLTGQIQKYIDCSDGETPSKALIKINTSKKGPRTYAPIYTCGISSGDLSAGIHSGDEGHKFVWYYHTASGNNTTNTELASVTTLGQVFGAVWNDYAEFRASDENEAGRVVCENGDGTLSRSYKRLQPGANIVTDTYGFAIGKTDLCQTPIAVSGRVLAYPYEDWWTFEPGEPVCAGPNGTVSKMTRREVRKYPERIIGTVSELPLYETWGQNNVAVNGRIWIHIK